MHLFAGLRVRDFAAARSWYELLLGEPSFFPHDTEAVWTIGDDRSVYVVEHPEGAGRRRQIGEVWRANRFVPSCRVRHHAGPDLAAQNAGRDHG